MKRVFVLKCKRPDSVLLFFPQCQMFGSLWKNFFFFHRFYGPNLFVESSRLHSHKMFFTRLPFTFGSFHFRNRRFQICEFVILSKSTFLVTTESDDRWKCFKMSDLSSIVTVIHFNCKLFVNVYFSFMFSRYYCSRCGVSATVVSVKYPPCWSLLELMRFYRFWNFATLYLCFAYHFVYATASVTLVLGHCKKKKETKWWGAGCGRESVRVLLGCWTNVLTHCLEC